MKKVILLAAVAVLTVIAGCRKIEVDGNGNNNGNGDGNGKGSTVRLTGRITENVTLKKGDENMLSGLVYITSGVTLTVEPGAVIKGDYKGANVAALIICRGGKIDAKGTQDEPIVFTSSSPDPRSGDWGGIVICGKASVNAEFTGTGGGKGIMEVEGGINNANGDGLAGGGDHPNESNRERLCSHRICRVCINPIRSEFHALLQWARYHYRSYTGKLAPRRCF